MISISIQFEQNQGNTFEMWIMMFLTHSLSKQTNSFHLFSLQNQYYFCLYSIMKSYKLTMNDHTLVSDKNPNTSELFLTHLINLLQM